MRKTIAVLVLSFVAGLGFTLVASPPAQAAGGGGGDCYYTCDCAGNGLYCCPTITGGVSCKSAPEWNCPQVYEC